MKKLNLIIALMILTMKPAAAQFQPFGADVERFDPTQCNPSVGCPEMDKLHTAGVQWIRLLVMWRWVEPNAPTNPAYPGIYGQWTGQHTLFLSDLDYQVNRARSLGMNVYLNFMWTPPWANDSPEDCSPLDAGRICASGRWTVGYAIRNKYQLLDLAYLVASHFRGRVSAYGVWNEPNLTNNFNLSNPREPIDEGQYLNVFADRYLFMVHNGVKAGDPTAQVVAPEVATNACGMPRSGCDWFRSWVEPMWMYFGGSFDVISFHEHRQSHNDAKGDVDRVYNRTFRPIWVTENSYDVPLNAEPNEMFTTYVDLFNRPLWQKDFYTAISGNKFGFCSQGGLLCENYPAFTERPVYGRYKQMTGY